MPPADHSADESFRDLVLRLRGRTGLTQRELAARIGVHARSIQGWEVGVNFPGVASLKALIAVGLQAGGFTVGREAEEAQDLWAAAVRDAPRFRMPFDGAWFQQIAGGVHDPVQDDTEPIVAAPPTPHMMTGSARRESWGEAPDVAGFLNRVSERALVRQWVLDEGSRLVAVLGLGGIGKSLLATRLAHDLAPSFEHIFWRSLRDAPTPGEWLAEALTFLAPDVAPDSGGEAALLRRFLELLGETRCLLVLDNVETILAPGGPVGGYRAGYERYGTLLRQVAESPHRSCLIVTSREEPAELAPLLGARGRVRALELAGFGTDDGRALVGDKQLDGNEDEWQALVGRYGGNGLALKVVGETTRELFGGSIANYLEYATSTSGVMVSGVRQLLRSQVQRLSDLEQELLRRLAVEREPVGPARLAADLGPGFRRSAVLEALEGLRRRSLLERAERGSLFGLQSVVLEYVTEQLVEDVAQALAGGEPDLLLHQPLIRATAKDYVRRTQERLIAGPILEQFVASCGGVGAAERRLMTLLGTQRGRPSQDQGYGPGNVVNLLRLLRGDLRGVDLSGLAIRQAYLQEVEAQGARLAGAHLSETVLGEAFSHPGPLATSGDGHLLAAGMASGEVCVWRLTDRTLVATLPGHIGAVWAVAMSGDRRLIASSGIDGTVRLWEAESGRPLAILQGHTGGVSDVALSGDGGLLVSGGFDGTVRLWDTEDRLPLAVLRGHSGAVWSTALSPNGRLVASGGADETVRLWETATGRPLAILRGHAGGVRGVALSADGRLLASGGFDGTVRLWDAEGRLPFAVLQGHSGGAWSVALSPDGRLVASGGADGTVRLWEAETGRSLATLQGHIGGVEGVVLGGETPFVASSGDDGTVRLWDAHGRLPLAVLQGHASGIWGVALSRDGRLVASGSVDGTVRLWDAATGWALPTLHGHDGGVWGVALSRDGRLVASAGADGTVRLWESEAGRPLVTFREHAGQVWCVALDGDGRLGASGGADGMVRLWETGTGRQLAMLQGHTGGVRGVALSTDGRLVASGSFDGTIRLWDADTGRTRVTLQGHTGGMRGVTMSADGRRIVSGSYDGMVQVWDVETGQMLSTLRGPNTGERGVALSGDGRLVASSGMDGAVRPFAVEGGRLLASLDGHSGVVWSVALGGDHPILASGGDDGTVRIWDAQSGALRHVLRGERRYEALDITGLTGVTDAQRSTLFALGAIERSGHTTPSS